MDDITKKTIEELVLNFISEMNKWEKYCNKFDEDQLDLDETEHKIKHSGDSFFVPCLYNIY